MSIKQESLEKLGPRLRMICNGDEEVNARRSELSASVKAPPALAQQYRAMEMLQQAVARPATKEALTAPPRSTVDRQREAELFHSAGRP